MRRLVLLMIWGLASLLHTVTASDLIRVSPVTDRLLVVYFDDGHINYGSASQGLSANVVYNHPLDAAMASVPSSYLITSTDDTDYQTAVSPVAAGRKSKGTEFNAPWANENKWVMGHWIYIELPYAIKKGKTYTIRLSDSLKASVENKNSFTFLYNEYSTWSPVIHINQIGYKINAPAKYAYLSQWMGDFNHGKHLAGGLNLDDLEGTYFHVVNQEDGKAVYSGTISLRRTKTNEDSDPMGVANFDEFAPERNYTHADVWQCDFSQVSTPGTYRIVVDRIGCSYPFSISKDPYFEPFYTTMKGLFIQRQGIHKYIEPGVELPRDHHPDDVDVRYNPDFKYWLNPQHGPKGWVDGTGTKVFLWGAYHDAGDWDTYPHHVKVPLALLMLYDMAPEKFSDGDIGNKYKLNVNDAEWINEGTNGIPDILDEARWLLDFYRRGRDELIRKDLGTGGVPGEYFGRDAGANSGPWQDTREWAVTAESPAATYYLAAMASWYSVCLKKAKGEATQESQILLQEAQDAYKWATTYWKAHPSEVINAVKEARYLAAACLYRITAQSSYQTDMEFYIDSDDSFNNASSDWSNPNTWFFAACNFAMLPSDFPGLDKTFQNNMVNKVKNMAKNNKIVPAQKRAFRLGFSMNRNFALGTFSTPRMLGTALAYELTGDKDFLKTIYFADDYFLGGNELNMVQVTGIGENPNRYVFHPTSWEINHYNSKVYSDESLPGLVTYFGDDDTWVKGLGDETWMRSSAYPPVDKWPESESRFDSRQSINGSEFTIHQSGLQAAVSYGYLTEGNRDNFTPNERPTVQITFPAEGQQFASNSDIQLQVSTSPNVARVEYYYNEHFIGCVTTAPFSTTWDDPADGSYTITAKAFDDKGLIVRPVNEENKVSVSISVGSGSSVSVSGVTFENCPEGNLITNSSVQLSAVIAPLDASKRELSWHSDSPEVLTVNKQGVVYTRSPGMAKVTVSTADGNYTASCMLAVVSSSSLGDTQIKRSAQPLWKIYPNPAKQKVTIEGITEPVSICARDNMGKIVFKRDNIISPLYELDISKIHNGLILIQIETKSDQGMIKKILRL